MNRIIVIEDNEPDLMMLEHALGEAGVAFQLDVIDDGLEARTRFEELDHTELPIPNLILLDLNVPKVDGLVLLQRIRESRRLCEVPVVIWSSTRSSRDLMTAQALRIADFVVKPADLAGWSQLARQLRSILTTPASKS
jgi:DNA-binding response OmpR family regulator